MNKIYCVLGSLFFSGTAFAVSCKNLDVYVVNNTHNDCKITNVAYKGELIKWNLNYIRVNKKIKVGELVQRPFVSPDMTLYISCGAEEKIVLYSKQNYCFLSGGSITGRVDSTNRMNAEYSIKEGSFRDGSNGTIVWRMIDG